LSALWAEILEDSPSLKNYLPTVVESCYGGARKLAAIETELAIDEFPVDCGYAIGQLLNEDFLP
jgi:hypothetical protein